MLLPDFALPKLENLILDSTGLDSTESCKDQWHFNNFNFPISYSYNSRGFRDVEWPQQLKESIWCLGDSFTVGMGLPFEFVWHQQIQSDSDVISVAMDGASNQWIARKAIRVLEQIQPTHMIIMWSYFHRREDANDTLSDMQRRIHYVDHDNVIDNYDNFENCVKSVTNANKNTKIIHALIPDCHDVLAVESIWNQIRDDSWPKDLPTDLTELTMTIQNEIKHVHKIYDKIQALCWCNSKLEKLKKTISLIDYEVVDLARDAQHFGVNTSKRLGKQLTRIIGRSVP